MGAQPSFELYDHKWGHNQKLIIENNLGGDEKFFQIDKEVEEHKWTAWMMHHLNIS